MIIGREDCAIFHSCGSVQTYSVIGEALYEDGIRLASRKSLEICAKCYARLAAHGCQLHTIIQSVKVAHSCNNKISEKSTLKADRRWYFNEKHVQLVFDILKMGLSQPLLVRYSIFPATLVTVAITASTAD